MPRTCHQPAGSSPPRQVGPRATSPAGGPAAWLDEHGDALFRLALLHLGRADRAEDAVQETLLAAVQAPHRVSNADSARAWLMGILRRKIVDQFREEARRRRHLDVRAEIHVAGGKGGGRDELVPRGALESAELRQALERGIRELPEPMRAAFTLRSVSGLETAEICGILDISPNHLGVLVHRARRQLRSLLARTWMARQEEEARA